MNVTSSEDLIMKEGCIPEYLLLTANYIQLRRPYKLDLRTQWTKISWLKHVASAQVVTPSFPKVIN